MNNWVWGAPRIKEVVFKEFALDEDNQFGRFLFSGDIAEGNFYSLVLVATTHILKTCNQPTRVTRANRKNMSILYI